MGLVSLLFQDPPTFVLIVSALLYSIIFHELAHGWVAYRLGDPTAKWLGRLTLNPIRHIDPIGAILLLLVGFGWAKPVPVNFHNFRDFRKGLILVSSAGITVNFILAFLAALGKKLLPTASEPIRLLFDFTVQINIMLAAFNLIPIPPLDGSKILMGFVSEKIQHSLARLEPFGLFIIIILLYLRILDPLIIFFQNLIRFLIGLLIGT